MPPAKGASPQGGGGNVWAQLLAGIVEGVVQKMTQKVPSPEASPKKEKTEQPAPVNAQQQAAPPMTQAMMTLLSNLSAKMNAQVPQGPQPKGQQPTAQTTAGVGGQLPPPQQPPPPAAPPPSPPPPQESLFKEILSGIGKVIRSPMVSARKGLESLNRAADDPDKMIEEGRERGGIGGALQSTAGFGLRGLQSNRPLSGAGDLAGAAGEMTGGPVKSFFKLNEVLFKSVDRLKIWNDRLHEGNIRFAEFSGQMFAVAKEQEAREIQLSIQKGEELAASARFQAEQKARLDNQLLTIETFWQGVQSRISGALSKVAADIIKLTPLGREELGEGGVGMLNWMRDLEEMESKREGSLIPPPKRWGPG